MKIHEHKDFNIIYFSLSENAAKYDINENKHVSANISPVELLLLGYITHLKMYSRRVFKSLESLIWKQIIRFMKRMLNFFKVG